eukprot:scaffold5872_cov104-Isochrysis_galbana.AAC.1
MSQTARRRRPCWICSNNRAMPATWGASTTRPKERSRDLHGRSGLASHHPRTHRRRAMHATGT